MYDPKFPYYVFILIFSVVIAKDITIVQLCYNTK